MTDEFPAMGQPYEIVSVRRAEPPPGAVGPYWYRYVIAFEGTNNIHGWRQGGLKAEIAGKIVASPRTEDARIRDRKITDQHYGPESVRAHSLEALRRAIEENIENHIGPVDQWTADPG